MKLVNIYKPTYTHDFKTNPFFKANYEREMKVTCNKIICILLSSRQAGLDKVKWSEVCPCDRSAPNGPNMKQGCGVVWAAQLPRAALKS